MSESDAKANRAWRNDAVKSVDMSLKHTAQVNYLLRSAADKGVLNGQMKGYVPLFSSVDVIETIEEVISSINPLASRKSIVLSFAARIDHLTMITDKNMLARILMNITSNAIKVSPRGGSVTATLSTEGIYAVITVSDNGPGFPEDILSTLFKKKDNPMGKVSGIGLTIVFDMVTALHGSISADNQAQGGARVSISLPHNLPEYLIDYVSDDETDGTAQITL